jgi:hypothetical protein
MTTLILELSQDIYQRLSEEAERQGKAPQVVVQEWVVERVAPTTISTSNREQTRRILQAAGLLTELGPGLKQMADASIKLEDVVKVLSRVQGKSLSEVVLEQRKSKEW